MKKNSKINIQTAALLTAALLGIVIPALAQNIGINATGSPPDNSALLDVDATGMNPKKGVLIPRMTTAERNAIPSPANSLLIFNTSCNEFQYWDGSRWMVLMAIPSSTSTGGSISFNYTGAVQSWTVPSCVSTLTIKVWGAGGAGGGWDNLNCNPGSGQGGNGGGGGYVQTIVNVNPGDVLSIYVGGGGNTIGCFCGGSGSGSGGWGFGNGGNGACGVGGGGGGGGGSAVLINNTVVVVAGGGGGGGGKGNNGDGGNSGGGGQNGFTSGGGKTGGLVGASTTTNGVNAVSVSDGGPSGAGGGGWNGGGIGQDGSSCDCGGGGGGGGGNYCGLGTCTIINGNGQTPGNSSDPDLCSGCAVGGNGAIKPSGLTNQTPGGNGLVIIQITKQSNITSASITSQSVLCNGTATGGATLNLTGGTAPFSYTWYCVMVQQQEVLH